MKLRRDKMSQAEYDKYLEIGEVDPKQNWLELFTPNLVSDLFTIMDSSSDNQDKQELVYEELKHYGFYDVGLGTNVYAVANPAYPGVVFKIALDRMGLADNFNDAILCDLVNSYLGKKKFTKVLARHPSGIVSVQERKVLVSNQDRMDAFRHDIIKTLKKLSNAFMIIDLSPSEYHYNYGIERNGDWCFIDASDLYPLEKLKKPVTCKMTRSSEDHPGQTEICGGNLVYNADFSAIYCEECGRSYIPSDVRPKEKGDLNLMVNFTSDGLSLNEIESMRREEMNALLIANKRAARVRDIPLPSDDTDDEIEEAGGPMVRDPKVPRPPKAPQQVPTAPTYDWVEQLDIPEDIPVQVHTPKQKSAFIVPRPVETLSPGVDRPRKDVEEVEVPKVFEPKPEMVQSLSTGFGPQKIQSVEDDDDEEDETEGSFSINMPEMQGKLRTITQIFGIDPVDDDEDDEEEEPDPNSINRFEDKLTYSIIHEDDIDGILVELEGDFEEAWKKYGLPLYFSVKGDKTLYQAVPAEVMLPRIQEAVYSAEDELGVLSADDRERYNKLLEKRKQCDKLIREMTQIINGSV